MKLHRVASVETLGYPTLKVTFDDGIEGVLDLSESIADRAAFAPLKDEAYFRTVMLSEDGRTFGWNLDDVGHEIDLCPDATRIQIETQIVEALASRFASARAAAA